MNTNTNLPEFLSIAELMRLSGECEASWRRRLSKRQIPYVKFGANVRVRRTDFEAWLESRTVPKEEVAAR